VLFVVVAIGLSRTAAPAFDWLLDQLKAPGEVIVASFVVLSLCCFAATAIGLEAALGRGHGHKIDRADAEHGDRRNDKGEFQGYGPPGLVQKPMQQPPCQTGQAGDHAALSCSPAAARRTSRSAPEARST